MAFSTNLRGLRSVAMAVLVSGSIGYAEQASAAEVAYKPSEKGVAENKSNGGKTANGVRRK